MVSVGPMRFGEKRGLDQRPQQLAPASADATADGRLTLARWMLGRWHADTDEPVDWPALEALQRLAWSEGVTVLVGDRLARSASVPAAVRQLCRAWTTEQAAAELGRRVRLKAVLALLDQAGIPVLVLKGAALAHWLYPTPSLRESYDVDLLFADRADAERAAAVLAQLGYVTPYRASRIRHELLCRSGDGNLDLDLHWKLIEWPVFKQLPGFATLYDARIALPRLGNTACGLGAPHALLHACVHRASNLSAGLGDRLKWLYDLHLLAGALGERGEWASFVSIATRAQGCGVCADGLAAASRLWGTTIPVEVTHALAAGQLVEPLDVSRLSDWRYVQRVNLRALDTWGAKAAWIWSRLLPPAGHLREIYGPQHGYGGLLWQRLRSGASRLVK